MKKFIEILKTISFGILASFAIGLGAAGALFVKVGIGPEQIDVIGNFISAFVFTLGLFLICTLGFKLYTGKIGYVIGENKTFVLDLLFIYIGNILGSILFGYIIYAITKNNAGFAEILSKTVANKTANIFTFEGFGVVFLKAILCGMCVFLAVHLYKTLKNPGFRYLGLIFPIMVFVICGFEHCIANAFYFSAANSWSLPALGNIAFATVGNSIGSIILYALFKWLKVEPQI